MTALPRLCLLQNQDHVTRTDGGGVVCADGRPDGGARHGFAHAQRRWVVPGPLSSVCVPRWLARSLAPMHSLAHCSSLAGGRRNPAGRHPESSSHQRATQVAVPVRRAQHVDLCAELRNQSDRAAGCFVRQRVSSPGRACFVRFLWPPKISRRYVRTTSRWLFR